MRQVISVLCVALLAAASVSAACPKMTNEHSDFLLSYSVENGLELHFRDTDRGRLYKEDEVILILPEAARRILPAGTPFGDEGAPFWLLPQNQDPTLLYLGLASDGVPVELISGPLHLRLRSVSGPGHFFAWQAGTQGLNVRMNSSDGISAEDLISMDPQSHAHYNWGFSAPGIYHVSFQVEANAGSGPVESELTTFVFHVLPLQGYEFWQAEHFLCPSESNLPGADPDKDGLANLAEYALGKNPLEDDGPHSILQLEWTEQNGQRHAVLEFRRIKTAQDVSITVLVAENLAGEWMPFTGNIETIEEGEFEIVRVIDPVPAADQQTRFYKLQLNLERPNTPQQTWRKPG
jgi:surface-anchored protein